MKTSAFPNKPPAAGSLTLVATPIGNLEDITLRAIRLLRECDLVAAEDTRLSGRLLAHFGIKKPMLSCYDANERVQAARIIERCIEGKTVCLVTSAGHPCVSDPGFRIVAEAILGGIPVSVAPGPCAAVSALSISGLPTDGFAFHGFLPRKGPERKQILQQLLHGGTHVIYESPKRLLETLAEFRDELGDPATAVTRELTKLHEETIRGRCSEILESFASREVLGEITITLYLKPPAAESLDPAILKKILEAKAKAGLSNRDAAEVASILFGIPKKEIYNRLIEVDRETS